MVMESPARQWFPPLGLGLAYVVEQGSPAKPQRRIFTDVVQHFQRVVEVVLVRPSVTLFHNVEVSQFGKDELQQSAALQVYEAAAGRISHDDFVQLHLDTLSADDFYAIGHVLQGLEGTFLYLKFQLGGKAYAAHHAQGVVAEGHLRVERRGDDAVLQVGKTVEGVYQLAETVGIETDGHGVDGKVAAVLVILQRTVLNDGLARITTIALTTGTDELHFFIPNLHLRRPEVLEHGEVCLSAQLLFQFAGHGDATAHDHHVDIVGRPF